MKTVQQNDTLLYFLSITQKEHRASRSETARDSRQYQLKYTWTYFSKGSDSKDDDS